MGFTHNSVSWESACNAGYPGLILKSGRSPGEGNGNPLQDSCLENPMDKGTWHATVHGFTRVRHNLVTKPTIVPCVCVCVCVCVYVCTLIWCSCVQLFVNPWTVACQVPPSVGFSSQEYCSGWPFPPPSNLSDSGIEPGSAALQADSLPSKPPGKPASHYTN